MKPQSETPKALKSITPKDEQLLITKGMLGFVYLAFLVGSAMILFGPVERVSEARINLIVSSPLLIGLGYITGRRGASTDTQGGANVNAPGGTVNVPPGTATPGQESTQ